MQLYTSRTALDRFSIQNCPSEQWTPAVSPLRLFPSTFITKQTQEKTMHWPPGRIKGVSAPFFLQHLPPRRGKIACREVRKAHQNDQALG